MTITEELDLVKMLQGVAGSQLGHGVAVAARDLASDPPGLMPDEEAAVARAVPARRREFAAGRAAARAALAQVGVIGQPIPSGADRAPVWPAGACGCITHTARVCLAAAARLDAVQSIGLDLEEASPLEPSLLDIVLTPAERDWLAAQPAARRGVLAKVIFSAKECAYKCQYPLTGVVLDFADLTIELDLANKRFHAVRANSGSGSDPAARMTGRFVTLMGHVLATMVLRR